MINKRKPGFKLNFELNEEIINEKNNSPRDGGLGMQGINEFVPPKVPTGNAKSKGAGFNFNLPDQKK